MSILDFMYQGEVSVTQEDLSPFLDLADELQANSESTLLSEALTIDMSRRPLSWKQSYLENGQVVFLDISMS